MGQAKRRGTYAERVEQAIERNKYEAERQKAQPVIQQQKIQHRHSLNGPLLVSAILAMSMGRTKQ